MPLSSEAHPNEPRSTTVFEQLAEGRQTEAEEFAWVQVARFQLD